MGSQHRNNNLNPNSPLEGESSDTKATGRAHERELDNAAKNKNPGELSSEKGDRGGENKVATSLDDE